MEITDEQVKLMVPNMPLTGECELNLSEIKKFWNEKFFISQWHDDYRLGAIGSFRVTITKKQAHVLIGELDLVCEQSDIFKSGKSWVAKPHPD